VRISLRHFLLVLACVLVVAGVSAASASGWGGYTFTPVAFPGHQAATWPWNVNTAGAVIGEYWAGQAYASESFGFVERFGHYWTISEPNRVSGDGMNAMELTASGDVIGGYYVPDANSVNNGQTGYIYIDRKGHFTNLSDPSADPDTGTWLLGANFWGEIVGGYVGRTDGSWHGFIYKHGAWTTVDACGSGEGTELINVSDGGLISGQCWSSEGFGPPVSNFLYTPQGQLITFPDLTAQQAPGILPNAPSEWGDSTVLWGLNDLGLRAGSYVATPTTSTCNTNESGATYYGYVEHNGRVTPIIVPSTKIHLPAISDPNTCAVLMGGANDVGQAVGKYDANTQREPQNEPPDSYGFLMTPNF